MPLFPEQDQDRSDEPRVLEERSAEPQVTQESSEPEVIEEGPSAPKAPKTEYQKLRTHLEEKKTHNERANKSLDPATTVRDMIERDMDSYETSGKRPPGLEQLYSALLSIPPTSAEVPVALHCSADLELAKPILVKWTWSNTLKYIYQFQCNATYPRPKGPSPRWDFLFHVSEHALTMTQLKICSCCAPISLPSDPKRSKANMLPILDGLI